MLDIDFKELERDVINELLSANKRAGKTVYPTDIVEIATRAAILAIEKYHQQVLQSQQETP